MDKWGVVGMEQIDKYILKFEDIPYDRKSIERVLTGFKDLDYYIKGIEAGLTTLVADTNMGKSILTASFLKKAIEQGYNVGVFASEHSARSYKMLLMRQNAKKGEFDLVPFVDRNGNQTNICDWYVNEESEKRTAELFDKHLVLFDNRRPARDIDTIISWIKQCYESCGTRFFVIDNYMEITQNNSSYDLNTEQTNILTKLRDIAITNKEKLFIVLVQHINKDSVRDTFRLTVKSGSGTSNSGNKAYNIIALYRKDCITTKKGNEKALDKFKQDCAKAGFDYDKCDSFLEVLKTKGNGNGVVGLKYYADTQTFEQAEKISKTDADKIYKGIQQKIEIIETDEIGDIF